MCLALQVQQKFGSSITLDVVSQGVLEVRDQVLATRGFRDGAKDASVERHGLQLGLRPNHVGQNELGAGHVGSNVRMQH